jgi:hypothetical protein
LLLPSWRNQFCGTPLERIGPVMQSYVDRGTYAGVVSTIVARRGVVVHEGSTGSVIGRRYDLPLLFHDKARRWLG